MEGKSSMNKLLTIALILMMVFLAACKPTGSQSDPNSAQNLQPSITGFRTQNLDVGVDAILTSAAGGSLVTGNVPLAAAIQRGDALLECLQNTGSLSGLMYIQENPDIIPQVGASIVINKTRVANNVLSCLTSAGASAQAVSLEPCAAQGEFAQGTDQYWFAYVGAGEALCASFDAHFTGLSATFISRYP
jgi:hypothetical protein